MANLSINESNEADLKRVVLLSQCDNNEHGKAILDTVKLWHDAAEKQLRGAYNLADDQVRYQVAILNTLRNVLDMPESAHEYLMNREL